MRRATAVAAALLVVTAGAGLTSGLAEASAKLSMTVSPTTVAPGSPVTVRISGTHRRRCTFTVRAAVKGARASVRRHTRSSRIRVVIPATSRAGDRLAKLTCGSRSTSVTFHVIAPAPAAGAPGSSAPVPLSEQLSLTDELPPGEGNPNDYTVVGPPNAGGAGFATYWPLAQGATAKITEGPGGAYSHATIYTQDAVDLDVRTGTEIRAGFLGVVARVNRGCAVGSYSCGNGYGNYVYLKATDGTCAVMAHLSRIDVNPGQQVAQYTLIGLSGNTGNSTGPHLHYDRVDCNNNRSQPWAPIEGGSLSEGTTIRSQNHPVTSGSPEPPPPPPPPPPPARTWAETVGGNAHTWTNYANAGGTQGPTVAAYTTVQISCRVQGFRVADGNTWWYRIASAPWSNNFYVSADAFYNNGQTSGSLIGTPFVDPAVATC